MNERIRELEDQCWVKVPCDFDMNAGGLSTIRTVFDRKKFAELIVADCVEQCNINFVGTVGTHSSAHNRGVKKCIDNIKQHFGVLE